MSDTILPPPNPRSARSRRGQTLVEFALLLPLLIVLFLGIADFGRVFSDGLILEAAARNGAEIAAQEYVQLSRTRPGNALTADDYTNLHAIALEAVCEEAAKLSSPVMAGGSCSMPYAAVCVHEEPPDGSGDPLCGSEGPGAPAECDRVIGPPAWDPQIEPGQSTDADHPLLPYVEVRLCYRFTTLFNLTDLQLPLANGLNLGEIWLQRDRVFVVGDY